MRTTSRRLRAVAGTAAAVSALASAVLLPSPASAATSTTYTRSGPIPVAGPFETSDGSGTQIKDAVGSVPAASEPYGTSAPVSGLAGTVTSVQLTIKGFTHPAPTDVDVMLVSPSGERTVVMSDAGGNNPVTGVDLTFDSLSSRILPQNATFTGGSYLPANYGSGDTFPAPAPSVTDITSLKVFSGSQPNGPWRLYVVDDAQGYTGSIAGWQLTVRAAGYVETTPSSLTVAGAGNAVTDVDVRVDDLEHSYPEDVELLLVGPHGQQAMVLSDVAETSPVSGVDLVLDDEASLLLGHPLVSGSYRPTNNDNGSPDVIGDGPTITGQSALSVFDGTDPNGTWHLYVIDDGQGDRGSLAAWSLVVTTAGTPPGASPSPTPTTGGGTAGGADTQSPRVSSTRPAAAATAVRRGADVTAKITEAVRPGTVTRASAYLVRKGSSKHLAATVTYLPGTRQVVIDPAKRLRAHTTYRAVISTAVKDHAGNRLDQSPTKSGLQPKTWRFTTR